MMARGALLSVNKEAELDACQRDFGER